MKLQSMSSTEFRAELKRLSLNQSTFAALAEVPLRTVQSWALGERKIPSTSRALIEKVERMSTKAQIIGITRTLPAEKLEILAPIVELVSRKAKEVSALRDEVNALKDEVRGLSGSYSKVQTELIRLRDTCAFQAIKLRFTSAISRNAPQTSCRSTHRISQRRQLGRRAHNLKLCSTRAAKQRAILALKQTIDNAA